MHSKDFLANELYAAGLLAMAVKAANGYYHDFLSPLDFPAVVLEEDLRKAGTPAAEALRMRHLNGEFDATKEESDEWAKSPEGQNAMRRLRKESVKMKMGFPHSTSSQMCLRCGHVCDRAASALGSDRAPEPGDATVCVRCGHVMAFDDAMKFRELTFKERAEFAGVHSAQKELKRKS
jgi:hypothetical protein